MNHQKESAREDQSGILPEKREILFEIAFEQAPCGLAHISPDGRLEKVNRRFRELLGCGEEAMEGASWDDLAEAQTVAEINRHFRRVLAGKEEHVSFEQRLIRKDGIAVAARLQIAAVRTGKGKPLFISMAVEDVSEQKSAAASVAEALRWRERYEAAMHTVGQVVYERDPSGNELLLGGSMERLLGYSASELSGGWRSWVGLIHPDDRLSVERQHLSAIPGEPFHLEYRLFRKDGRVANVREEGCMIEREGASKRSVVSVLVDVSDQRDLALQLQHAQKMEVFGRLAGGVAHDFNNLLTVLSGYTDMLMAEFEGDDPCREYLDEMQRAAERASALTSQLLAFGRMQRSSPRPIHLGEVLSDLRKMLRRLIGEDIELVSNVSEGLGMVQADPRQIETVLINLVVNARDAMPHGGRISIEIGNAYIRPNDRRIRAGWKSGPYVQMTVTDTGIGMDPMLSARVFEPFFTTKPPGEGTGLGLATCYGIIEQSGGRIAVESTPGQGSTFRIYLPRVRAEAALHARREASSRSGSSAPRGKGETILLVEDDLAVQKIYSTMLRRLGYNVLCGSNGDEALRIARQHPEIGLVITDLVMPFMSGIDLAEELRHTSPNTKVVLISGYASEPENLNSARRIPFLAKPLSRDTLACTLRELLETA